MGVVLPGMSRQQAEDPNIADESRPAVPATTNPLEAGLYEWASLPNARHPSGRRLTAAIFMAARGKAVSDAPRLSAKRTRPWP